MKKQIPIFIAGAKSFREQRVALKAMANDLNTEFTEQKKDAVLYMCSYDNFGDHQDEYNQFIANVADLVIFVLDGSIGTHTEEEFRLAVSEFKKDKVPQVYVFLKEFKEHTEQIRKIEGLLEEAFGPHFYYISYATNEELCSKAKDRILQYVNQYQHRINLIRRGIAAAVVVLLMLASFFTAFVLNRVNQYEPEPMLVFAGGGSAASYLDSIYDYDVIQNTKEQKSVFINMPSGDSYSLLTDWILEHSNTDNIKDGNNFFFPISLSASEAKPEDFTKNLKSKTDLTKKGIILAYFMGYDTLSVLFYNPKSVEKKDVITINELKDLLRHNDTLFYFTTRDNSGTYVTYLNMLDSLFVKEKDNLKAFRRIFYKEDSADKLKEDIEESYSKYREYVVLGSNFYQPTNSDYYCKTNGENYRKRYVVDSLGNIMKKAVFIYIPAWLEDKDKDGENYDLPENAKRFIHDVDDTLKLNLNIPQKGKPVVIHYIKKEPEER